MEQVCQIAILSNDNISCVLMLLELDWIKFISTRASVNLEDKMYLSA